MKFTYRIVSLVENLIDEETILDMMVEIIPVVDEDLNLEVKKLKNKVTEKYEEHKHWLINKCSLVVRDLAIETSIQSDKKETAEALQKLKFAIKEVKTKFIEEHDIFEINVNLKPNIAPVFFPDFSSNTIIFSGELTGDEDFDELPGIPEE